MVAGPSGAGKPTLPAGLQDYGSNDTTFVLSAPAPKSLAEGFGFAAYLHVRTYMHVPHTCTDIKLGKVCHPASRNGLSGGLLLYEV